MSIPEQEEMMPDTQPNPDHTRAREGQTPPRKRTNPKQLRKITRRPGFADRYAVAVARQLAKVGGAPTRLSYARAYAPAKGQIRPTSWVFHDPWVYVAPDSVPTQGKT